ncbi:MAG: hypothetical protein Q8L55_08555 [Phycisphaerales bacterium]|nr:hypothetical protein [Phycisphaerales bacterium]
MFLPALLWRDYGVWSFAAFALPNIVGAAAMGLVMRSPRASSVFLERHRWACFAFSAVTVAFQVFFAAWVARVMGGGFWHAGWLLCVAALLLSRGGPSMLRTATLVGLAVWVVSVATLATTVARESGAGMLPEVVEWTGVLPGHHLVPLAMVCLLGFGLCPYLDRTFHRARIEAGTRAVRVFGIGFGFLFAVMIAGTLLTAPLLVWIVGATGGAGGQAVGRLLVALFAAHTLPQLVYTVWVHGCETRGNAERIGLAAVGLIVGLAVVLAGAGPLVRQYGWDIGWANPLFGGEVVYRGFMAFYGLVFPAYVAVVAWPMGDGGRVVARRNILILGAVLLVAGWFYWAGFVERHTWWVAGGVAVVVLGSIVACVVAKPARATGGLHDNGLPGT